MRILFPTLCNIEGTPKEPGGGPQQVDRHDQVLISEHLLRVVPRPNGSGGYSTEHMSFGVALTSVFCGEKIHNCIRCYHQSAPNVYMVGPKYHLTP